MIEAYTTNLSSDCVLPNASLPLPPHSIEVLRSSLLLLRRDLGVSPEGKRCFVGIGYKGPILPIDTVGLILAGVTAEKLTVLVTDEFQRINNVSRDTIESGARNLEDLVKRMNALYGLSIDTVRASEIMEGRTYDTIYRNCRSKLQDSTLRKLLKLTVPGSRVADDPDCLYSIHEIAICRHLQTNYGYEVKLGPTREIHYDRIMEALGFNLQFSYAIDALPMGPDPKSVVHYIADDKGSADNARVLLTEPEHHACRKLREASPEAVEYLIKVGEVARCLRIREPRLERMIAEFRTHVILPLMDLARTESGGV